MIRSYMSRSELCGYLQNQKEQIGESLKKLDPSWTHADVVREYLRELCTIAEGLEDGGNTKSTQTPLYDRKKEKYTNWVEVLRLALFQYERFVPGGKAWSEGLYASLAMAAAVWNREKTGKILVIGCGPGRSVLDFSRLFPAYEVEGLDYSLFSLMLAEKIVCGTAEVPLLRRDVYSDAYSELLMVPGMGRKNVSFGLIDLSHDKLPESDMIVCSNVLNLLPDHADAARRIYQALHQDGLLIFADLLGWRLDREETRKGLRTPDRIRTLFEETGFITLDQFAGVPYIESESSDQQVLYKEHFYIGRKP